MIEFLLAGVFSDHMVLQQQRSNPVWGWDRPGQLVSMKVEKDGAQLVHAEVRTAADGSWRLACPPLPAGGPYRITLEGSRQEILDDVLVGEVWLAAGQSNMAWSLSATDTAAQDMKDADLPQVRFIKLGNQASESPQRLHGGTWAVCSPQTAGNCTAVGYYHAAKLNRTLHVPVGVIDASWGGTRIEAWLSESACSRVMDLKAELSSLADAKVQLPMRQREFGKRVSDWEQRMFPADPGNAGEGRGWSLAGFDDSAWRRLRVPGAWGLQGLPSPAAVWYRRPVEIPRSWEGRELTLSLGMIDDFDDAYFNGVRVGGLPRGTYRASTQARTYTVPASAVHAGGAVIAVRVFDQNGGGGLLGPAGLMGLACSESPDTPALPLSGEWSAQLEAAVGMGNVDWGNRPWPDFAEEQHWPASIHNGMVAPIAGYGLRGALWYQGETNCDTRPETYGAKLQALIRDWRARWGGEDFPVLLVQLPNFKGNEGWPIVREAQQQAARELPQVGLVVTIDAGDPDNLHPKNKSVIGSRLATLALADVYAVPGLAPRGPDCAGVAFVGGRARIQFLNAAGLCTGEGGAAVRGFELAGADGAWHAAEARIEGESVLVESPAVADPRSVRYAWAANPDCNLRNAAGLPAAPFRR